MILTAAISSFFGDNFVQILQTGFAGVSVLLMYMAYRLLSGSIKTEQSIEKLRENRISIFGFMAFSTFVMAGALFITIKQKPEEVVKVNVAFLPNDPKALDMLDFSIAGLPQQLPAAGVLSDVELKEGRGIIVNLNRMNQHMNGLENNLNRLEQLKTTLEGIQASLMADKEALTADKLGLQSQLNLFIKEKAESVLETQDITITEQTRQEESGA